MKIRCKKFGDDYTQVQGHEDTIVDFLKDHSFYLRWSYTHEKDKFYGSKFSLTHPVTLQTKTFKNTPETYYKLMPKGEILIEERDENQVYTAVLFTMHKEKGKFEDLAWADLLLQAPNFYSLQTISTGHEYVIHTVFDEEQNAYPVFEGGVIIFNEHKHIKAVFNDADGDGFKKTLIKNGYQPI